MPGARDRRLRGAGAAPEPDPPLRLRGKPRAGGRRSAPRTPVPKVAAIRRKSLAWGSDLGGGGCFVPVPGGGGWRRGGTQHKGLAREGGIAHVGWPWPRVDPPHAGGRRASGRAGREVGGWMLQVLALGPQCRAERPPGPASFRGQKRAHAAGASGRTGPGLAPKSEKVSNGTDVRPLTPTPRVRDGAGGAGELWWSQVRGGRRPKRAARRRGGRLRLWLPAGTP